MARTADIAVVGGGIAGCALAYFLAEQGIGSIVLLERAALGSGSTAQSMGGVRQQFSTPLEIELSKRALAFWRGVEKRFGMPCPFYEDGYLFLTSRESILEGLREAAAAQRQAGAARVEVLPPAGLAALVPWLSTDGLVGGSWTPHDGRVIPTDGLYALAAAARRLGVFIHEDTPVTGISRAGSGWLVAGENTWSVATVVLACGLWTPELVRPFGVTLPIHPMPVHYATTEPALDGQLVPLTIDLDTGLLVERDGSGLCLSLLVEGLPPDYNADHMLADLNDVLQVRAPVLRDVGVKRTALGVIDMSADGHPYVGRLDDGLWVLAGFGGHGTMHAPVLAEALAARIAGRGEDSLDLEALDPRRSTLHAGEWMVASRKD